MKKYIDKIKNFSSRKFYTAFFLAIGISALTFHPVFAENVEDDDDDVEEVADQMLIISKDTWNNREINLIGRGSRNLLIYGNTRAGALNNATIDGSQTPIYIYGGYYDGSLEQNEIVDVTGNKINVADYGEGWIFFETGNFDDSYNRLHLYDVTDNDLKINVIGGRSGYGKSSGNVINIYGGKLNGYVIAAENKDTALNPSANIFDNEINVYNSPNLREIKLYGAAIFSDDTRERTPIFGTNNTLNFYTKNIDVTELNGFNNYNFYLPDSITHHDIVLNVIGEKITDISGAKVFAVVPQVPTIDPHEKIILIKNHSGIIDSDATNYDGVNEFDGTRQWQANPTSIYDIHVRKLDENNVVVSFTGNSVTPPTNLIPRIRQTNMLSGAGDFISDFGGEGSFGESADIFGDGGGGTFDGAKPADGGGNFDSYLSSGEYGQGHSQYLGGGIVFHTKLSDGNFYNGSIRGGRLKSDFESFDFGLNGYSVYERFTSNSPYIAAHFDIGREVKRSDTETFTYYGKFLYSHTFSDNINLTSGEDYYLSSVNSLRLKLGIRESWKINSKNKFYAGLAYQYEFGGKSYAIHDGLKTDTPSLRGSSGVVELGWIVKPHGDNTLSLDCCVTGTFGKNRGLMGRFGVNWLF